MTNYRINYLLAVIIRLDAINFCI